MRPPPSEYQAAPVDGPPARGCSLSRLFAGGLPRPNVPHRIDIEYVLCNFANDPEGKGESESVRRRRSVSTKDICGFDGVSSGNIILPLLFLRF